MGQSSNIVVGSKEAALTAEDVYSVAHRRCAVELDTSSLEILAARRLSSVSILPCDIVTPVNSESVQLLSDAEARATLVVLLHKLLRGPPGIRKFLPLFIGEILNLGLSVDIPATKDDLSLVPAFVANLYIIKKRLEDGKDVPTLAELEKEGAIEVAKSGSDQSEQSRALKSLKSSLETSKAGEIGVTRDEVTALENSFAASIGIAALSFYSLNTYVGLADAVAALSFEALLASTESFKPECFKQAFNRKSEVDVARDLNSLLFGSKLAKAGAGGLDEVYIRNVPSAHGALKDAVNILASRIRIDINREEIIYKKTTALPASSGKSSVYFSSGASSCTSSLFTSTMSSVLVCLWPVISDSFERTSKCFEFIRTNISECDEQGFMWGNDSAGKITTLKSRLQAAGSTYSVSGDENAVFLSRETLSTVETWRSMLVEEGTASLASLYIRERLSSRRAPAKEAEQGKSSAGGSRSNVGLNGGISSVVPVRTTKIKNNFVLGKGTDIVRSTILGHINTSLTEKSATIQLFNANEGIDLLLRPSSPEVQALVTTVRNVLESSDSRRLPKIAKGTRDFTPVQMAIREKAFGIITTVFKRHGAVSLDTPVFELRETLMGKYGEDSKLIYDLADQGGEILSLRYDLTVPFARYLAMNKVENMKRYHIARVYRRDNPAKGRYREFYQCDLDIAGRSPNPMVYDFEVLKVVTELLDELEVGDYEVKLNHRKLLDGMLHVCGVPQAKFRSICSAIDKLDKLSWEQVQKEMVEEKGLTLEVADKIGVLVQKRGNPLVILEELQQSSSPFSEDAGSVAALKELGVLFKYLKASGCIDRIVFDLSLARGLDYYTGVIYEATLQGSNQVGSIAAGGRYDDLVGMFSGKQVPAVGVSLGIERVFVILEKLEEDRKRVMRSNETQVLVVALGKDERWTEITIEIVTSLWKGKLKAEFACVASNKISQQITKAVQSGIPWVVLFGEDELKAGIFRLKNIAANSQEDVKRENLVTELQRRLGIL